MSCANASSNSCTLTCTRSDDAPFPRVCHDRFLRPSLCTRPRVLLLHPHLLTPTPALAPILCTRYESPFPVSSPIQRPLNARKPRRGAKWINCPAPPVSAASTGAVSVRRASRRALRWAQAQAPAHFRGALRASRATCRMASLVSPCRPQAVTYAAEEPQQRLSAQSQYGHQRWEHRRTEKSRPEGAKLCAYRRSSFRAAADQVEAGSTPPPSPRRAQALQRPLPTLLRCGLL